MATLVNMIGVAAKCIAMVDPEQIHPSSSKNIDALLASVGIDHAIYADGPLKQSFLINDTVASRRKGINVIIERHAILYLHLRNRTLWVLELTGMPLFSDIAAQLCPVAEMLLNESYDEIQFERIEQKLTDLFVPSNGGILRICRHGPAAPSGRMLTALVNRFIVNLMYCAPRYAPRQRTVRISRWIKKYVGIHLKLRTQSQQFFDRLDQGVMRGIDDIFKDDRIDALQINTYNYFAAKSEQQSSARLQAIRTYPWLRFALTNTQEQKLVLSKLAQPQQHNVPDALRPMYRKIQEAIDHSLPVAPSVADVAGLPLELVLWSTTWLAKSHTALALDIELVFLTTLSWLPASHRPVTESDWAVFMKRIIVLVEWGGLFFMSADHSHSQFGYRFFLNVMWASPNGRAILRNWLQELAAVDQSSTDLQQSLHDLIDSKNRTASHFLITLSNALDRLGWTIPSRLCAEAGAGSTVRQRWLQQQTVDGLLKMAEDWDRQKAGIDRYYDRDRRDKKFFWPTIIERPLALGAFQIVALGSEIELEEESKKSYLWLATYFHDLDFGNSILFSLRDRIGLRLATIECRLQTDPLRITCAKVDGYAYAPTGDEWHQVAAQLVAELNKPAYCSALKKRLTFQQECWRAMMDRRDNGQVHVDEVRTVSEMIAWRIAIGPDFLN